MKRNEMLRFLALRTLGNFLLLMSLYGVFVTFGPALRYQLQYTIIQVRGIHFTVVDPHTVNNLSTAKLSSTYQISGSTRAPVKTPGFADILAGDKQQLLMPKDPLFSILIPKIGASAKIFPNVDPNNPQEFLPILKQGVAHAKGSVFPGHAGNTYLFAHSADNWWDAGAYNAIFYTLWNLSKGDEIDIFFENRRYTYVVSQKVIHDPEDVSLLTAEQTGKEQLVLQTCWPPGTTWKRLYVIAERKQVHTD